ncbi:uncharacterized protein [Rutidosis leptorrhynchoides]|uniref:uncharacterized protein n=1 Tax=Rutidosis leptorrhynchoides TaxID=125765 RepID=UPI003A9956D8
MLAHVVCDVECVDLLFWSASTDGLYSVSEALRVLVQLANVSSPTWPKVIWGNNVPYKVMLFHWLAIRNSIPVEDVLIRRHILPSTHSNLCIWCLEDPESVNHLLAHWSIELFSFDWYYGMGIKASKFWKLIGPAIIWAIWLARNDFVFNGKFICRSVLVRNIKLKTLLWATNLNLCNGCQSYVWMDNPALLCF